MLENKSKKAKMKLVIGMYCVAFFLTVICVSVCFTYWKKAAVVCAAATTEEYGSVKDAKINEIRQEWREKGYAAGEEEYHTSNRISINVENVRRTADLEVLEVRDIVYIVEDENVQAWLKAAGKGVYTVDLAAGEYLIDNERHYVLVRVPRPELKVDLEEAESVFYKDDRFIRNGSISEGANLAREQRAMAQMQLQEDVGSNQRFYQAAEDSAVGLIRSLVLEFNMDVSDLTVDVEFFD